MKLITVAQAAIKLKVSHSRVLALITAGRLRAQKIGMQYLIEPSDLAAVRVRKVGRPRKPKPMKA